MKKVKMAPSDWGTLQGLRHAKEFTKTEFEERMRFEAEREVKKIQTHTISNMTCVLTDKQFDAFCSSFSDIKEEEENEKKDENEKKEKVFCPIMSWHGAHPDSLSDITEKGFKLPGDVDPDTGKVYKTSHGSMYGYGVYTSSYLGIASCYASADLEGDIQLLLNVTQAGSIKFLDKEKIYSHLVPSKGSKTTKKNKFRYIFPGDDQNEKKEQQEEEDDSEYDCVALPDLSVMVSPDPCNVFPCFLVTLKPNQKWVNEIGFKPMSSNVWSFRSTLSMFFNPRECVPDEEVEFTRIGADYYTIKLPSLQHNNNIKIKNDQKVHHLFVVPDTVLHDVSIMRSIGDLVSTFCARDAVTCIFYGRGDTQKIVEVSSKSCFFDAADMAIKRARNLASDKRAASNLCGALEVALQAFITHDKKNEDSPIWNLLVFVDANPDVDQLYSQVVAPNAIFAQKRKVCVKTIFVAEKPEVDHLLSKYNDDIVTLRQLHSLDNWERDYYHYLYLYPKKGATEGQDDFYEALQGTVTSIIKDREHNLLENNQKRPMRMPYPYGRVGQGFMTSFTQQPRWDVDFDAGVVFKGDPPPHMWLVSRNGEKHAHKITVVTKRPDIQACLENLLPLFYRFRNYCITHPKTFKRFAPVATLLASSVLQISPALLDPQTLFLFRTLHSSMSGIMTELKTLSNITLEGTLFRRLAEKKFAKDMVKRVQRSSFFSTSFSPSFSPSSSSLTSTNQNNSNKELIKEIQVKQKDTSNELTDILLCSEEFGWPLKVTRTNASCVEPWLLIVNRVEPDMVITFGDVVAKEEYDTPLPLSGYSDDLNDDYNDVLLLPNQYQQKPNFTRSYFAYTFTRVPQVYMPSMQNALYTNVWCKMMEVKHFPALGNHASSLQQRLYEQKIGYVETVVRGFYQKNQNAKKIIETIEADLLVQKFSPLMLREAEGLLSVNMLLGALLDSRIFSSPRSFFGGSSDDNNNNNISQIEKRKEVYHTFCFSVLMEAVMRSTRAYCKSYGVSPQDLMYKILGLDDGSEQNKFFLNKDKAYIRTGNIFKKMLSLTNCSPFCVVAVIHELETRSPELLSRV